ncbi:MAG: hypothetical protein ACFCVK_20115 [Acidimicrobiales bacterium]
MLRASSNHTDRPVDLRAIVDVTLDPALPAGRELLAFTDAAVLGDAEEMPGARRALLDTAGPAAVIRAAAVAGNFQMMNRLLHVLGVRVRRSGMALADDLGVQVPPHLHPS